MTVTTVARPRFLALQAFVALAASMPLMPMALMPMALMPSVNADEAIDLWTGMAPGEVTRETGIPLPRREQEQPPATRIQGITRPQLHRFDVPADRRNGTSVLIFPGGGYNYVVADKEGSEAATWLNQHGVTAFVVHYRTKSPKSPDQAAWSRPLQDGQRAVSLIRHHAQEWGLNPRRIGVLGFSAGGQAAALVTTRFQSRQYESIDEIDKVSCRPDFAMLVYPWQLVDPKSMQLIDLVTVTSETPPTFLAHAHDDSATSLSSVLFYAALKQRGVRAELHIYENGGHGYGMRPVENSNVHTWPRRAEDWLKQRNLLGPHMAEKSR